MTVIKVHTNWRTSDLKYQIFMLENVACSGLVRKHTQRDGMEWNNKANAKKTQN